MLLRDFMPVLSADNKAALRAEAIRFAQSVGFETVNVPVVLDRLGADAEFIVIDNAPAEFKAIAADKEYGRRDPVLQHCKKTSVPIVWDQSTYTAAGQGDMWEMQARFGYKTGLAVALHLGQGRHVLVAVERDQPLPETPHELRRVAADLQLFAAHAQDVALSLMLPHSRDSDAEDLTPRELESLRWTMEGKTAWELGRILGISEQTAARHLNNATRKLGCVNKLQAVLKALRFGLVR